MNEPNAHVLAALHLERTDPAIADLMYKTSGFEASLRLLVEAARAVVGADASDLEVWTEALRHLHYDVVDKLLEYLPTLAGPWEVTDTKARQPTRAVRIGWQGQPIAEVRRLRHGAHWSARVGDARVECSDDQPFWTSYETAIAACDDRLIADGVKFKEGTP